MSFLHSFPTGNLVFNPVDIDEERSYNDWVDPDKNSLNLRQRDTCHYYNEVEFNALFSAFHLNTYSLPKKLDLLIQFLSTIEHQLSVLALTETWLNEDIRQIYSLPQYNAVHFCRK